MSRRCEQCGAVLRDDDRDCPYCGAVINETQTQPAGTYKVPQTIAELKQFCEDRGMPLEKMRFFIGEDYREPRAFGIYQDEDGQFVVYKNKDTGERAIRYRGEDEAFAVHELYEKLKSEAELRRNKHRQRNIQPSGDGDAMPIYHYDMVVKGAGGNNFFKKLVLYVFLLATVTTGAGVLVGNMTGNIYEQSHGKRGYYEYNDTAYYHFDDDWYYYDPSFNDWYQTSSPFSDYEDERAAEERSYVGGSYDGDSFYTDWNNSAWYDDYFPSSSSDSSSDYDSDSSWSSSDFDSWDSFDTDWGSDW